MELKVEELRKRYGDKTAVDGVTLNLTQGIWGLLGANGAGKTTLIKMIADIVNPTDGKIFYNGKEIKQLKATYRDIFGFLPQDFVCQSNLTVNDFLEYVAACKGLYAKQSKERITFLLETLNLTNEKHRKVMKLSGGNRRRVGIAQAVLNEPKVLILDEPTAGLDPGERIKFRKFITKFSRNCIILISTHIVSDIEYVSTKNIIFKEGKAIKIGTTEELTKEIEGKVWTASISLSDLYKYESTVRIVNQKSESRNMLSVRYLGEEAIIPNSSKEKPRLEDLYLWLFPELNERGEHI